MTMIQWQPSQAKEADGTGTGVEKPAATSYDVYHGRYSWISERLAYVHGRLL